MVALSESPVKWTMENEQLAAIFDALALQLWQNENQGRKKHELSKRPDPSPRPSDMQKINKEKENKATLAQRLLEQKERLYAGQSEIRD